jgi:hypothetical protein
MNGSGQPLTVLQRQKELHAGKAMRRDSLSAPRGVELDKDVLVVRGDLVKLVRNEDVHRLVLNGRLLTLDRGLDLAGDKVGNERGDVVVIDLLGLVERELGHLLDALDRERGPGRLLEVQRLGVVGELRVARARDM